jgi:hypothetical protein
LLLQFTYVSPWLNLFFWQKKSLLTSKRLAKSAFTSYLSAYADGFSTFPIWGLLQLRRADPSAAPDKIVND